MGDKCTSVTCPYKDTCYRQVNDDVGNTNQSWFNFEYGCSENSGFSEFIPILRK